jgi:hypothetical protein
VANGRPRPYTVLGGRNTNPSKKLVYLVCLAQVQRRRVAAKTPTKQKTEKAYEEAVAFFEGIVQSGFQSIRDERVKRKDLANRVGLTAEMIRNMERGHRDILLADFIVLSLAMGKKPEWFLEEILRRFGEEIENWRSKAGYRF